MDFVNNILKWLITIDAGTLQIDYHDQGLHLQTEANSEHRAHDIKRWKWAHEVRSAIGFIPQQKRKDKF